MDLLKFNNKIVRITDIDDQIFEGICLFHDKEIYDEAKDALEVKTSYYWTILFEDEIKTIEIIE